MTDEAMIEAMARDAAGRVLQDKVYDEAQKRHLNDATQSGFEHHLIRVAAEHGIRSALQPFLAELKQEIRREALEEAAKVADGAALEDCLDPGCLHCQCARDIARAIRTLIQSGEG